MPEAKDAALIRDIAAFLSSREKGSWQLRRVVSRDKSEGFEAVFHARAADGRQLAVKQCAHPRKTINEYHALQRLAESSGESLRAFALDPQSRFFAMEWVDAPLVKQMMHEPNRLELIQAAGRWLRRLHDRTWRTTPLRDPAMEGALLIDPQGSCFRELDRRLARRRRRLGIRRSGHALLHTDYHIGNIFAGPNGLIPFDPTARRRGMPVFDLADFLTVLMVYRHHAAFQGRPWPDSRAVDRREFLKGYGRFSWPQRRLMGFAQDLKIARMWHHHAKLRTLTPLQKAEHELLDAEMRRRGLLPKALSAAG